MTHQLLLDGLIAAHKDPANELKVMDASASPGASEEVRAKLAECQLTDEDMSAAIEWARTKAPTI